MTAGDRRRHSAPTTLGMASVSRSADTARAQNRIAADGQGARAVAGVRLDGRWFGTAFHDPSKAPFGSQYLR
jgi:hypothetical protein